MIHCEQRSDRAKLCAPFIKVLIAIPTVLEHSNWEITSNQEQSTAYAIRYRLVWSEDQFRSIADAVHDASTESQGTGYERIR